MAYTDEDIKEIIDSFIEGLTDQKYIGARYVPVFGRKGETSIAWDNTAPYEPLTVVLHNGTSYTSRQFVPTGIAITDGEFWAETGNLNAQLVEYNRQLREAISDEAIAREEADSNMNDKINELASYLPSTDFSEENTVKDYIDDISDSINNTIEDDVSDWMEDNAGTTIEDWLDDHPEATTTVQDGSITNAKLVQTGGVLSSVEYLRKLFTNIDSWEVFKNKYASYSGTTVNLYNVANSGCIKIPVSDYTGQLFNISAESLNTTYNVCYILSEADNTYITMLKTTGVTSYKNKKVSIPSNAAYLYVNFDYTNGTVEASAERIVREEPYTGTIQSKYPLITYDSIAKTLEIRNVVDNNYFPVYISYRNGYTTISNGSTQIDQSFSNVNSGTLYYDVLNKEFVFTSSYTASDTVNYVLVAEFRDGVITKSNAAIRTVANEYKHGKKRLVCYGDSLTWYDGKQATWGAEQGTTIIGFESYLRAYLNMSVQNLGNSGETLPQICARMASDAAARNCDMLMLMGGDNDDRHGVSVGTLLPSGSAFDTTTTIGSMQNAIEAVLSDNPNVVILLATEPMGWCWNGSVLQRVDEDYPNAIRRVAEYYGLPLLDLWNISGVNELTRNTMYLDPPDTTNQQYMYHPSNYGWSVISPRIIQFVQTL